MKLADGMNVDIDPSVVNGHRRPFMSYVKKFEDFTVLTKLKFEVRPFRRHRDAIT